MKLSWELLLFLCVLTPIVGTPVRAPKLKPQLPPTKTCKEAKDLIETYLLAYAYRWENPGRSVFLQKQVDTLSEETTVPEGCAISRDRLQLP